ncbi:MAG: bacillithiol biosynthesis BshC, partial [Bryobacterales bacterium]|nr:bacillithiol biosynthesis BshC [Bryobacterales bacterium]
FQESTSLLMLFERARRIALKRKNGSFLSGSRAYSSEDLVSRLEHSPLDISPSALLRPVMQDFLLPTAALIAGPSEAAYLAQSSVLYEKLLERMPAVLPRATFTVLDGASAKLLRKYGLTAPQCLVPRREFEGLIANSLVPPSLGRKLAAGRAEIEGRLLAIESDLRAFDPTLAASFGLSRRKIEYQLDKSEGKVARESLRRGPRAQRHAAKLADWVYPRENMQERVYCALSLVAMFGTRFVDDIRAAVEPGSADHKLLCL